MYQFNIGDIVTIKEETRKANHEYKDHIVNNSFLLCDSSDIWQGYYKQRFRLVKSIFNYYFY